MTHDSERLPGSQSLKGEENYEVWKPLVKHVLVSKSLDEYIEAGNECPPTPKLKADETETQHQARRTAYRTWRAENARAMMILVMNMNTQPQRLVAQCLTAREVWDTLQALYDGRGYNSIYQYIAKLISIKYEHYNSIQPFVIEFNALKERLGMLKASPPEVWYIVVFIHALEGTFPAWAGRQRSIHRVNPEAVTLDVLITDILDESSSVKDLRALHSKAG